jgi:hypothetical protein
LLQIGVTDDLLQLFRKLVVSVCLCKQRRKLFADFHQFPERFDLACHLLRAEVVDVIEMQLHADF